MRVFLCLASLLALAGFIPPPAASAHCEVPCGIYGDGARFVAMREDLQTIQKAMEQINLLAGKVDPLSINQIVRWIHTKEDHAGKIQHVIAQYFMTQRIKPAGDEAGQARYVDLLTKAHAVLVGAMTCKQTVDVSTAGALGEALHAFEHAYVGPPPTPAPDGEGGTTGPSEGR